SRTPSRWKNCGLCSQTCRSFPNSMPSISRAMAPPFPTGWRRWKSVSPSAKRIRSARSISELSRSSIMPEYALPILGFGDSQSTMRVQWADGTRLTYAGILGHVLDPEYQAEQTRRQELRDSGVVLLEDYK